jgi:hypothetical protein
MSFEREFQKNHMDDLKRLYSELSADARVQALGFALVNELENIVIKAEERTPVLIRFISEGAEFLLASAKRASDDQDYCLSCHGSGLDLDSSEGPFCQVCSPSCLIDDKGENP